ncbi:MAG: PIN domain-containing protein [Chloroflexi bacterium]|nr:PIN domain-containing protein [Chloroflexota bacterium]
MTSVADTRLLLTLEFPPTLAAKEKARDLFEKELRGYLLVPSIVLAEFVEYAGARIGEEAAKTRLRLLKERGMQTVPVEEENALIAGCLLLSHRNVPIADAIIASYVKSGVAEYVVTDDVHFRALGVKTRWI